MCFAEVFVGFKDRKDAWKGEVPEGALKEPLGSKLSPIDYLSTNQLEAINWLYRQLIDLSWRSKIK